MRHHIERIVTRPDFDGIVCAMLLRRAIEASLPILWVEPGDMQAGKIDIQPGDVLANLPFDLRAAMWFDHHYSNRHDHPFEGAYDLTPSAARLIYDYYRPLRQYGYAELLRQTDKIDAADLTRQEVLNPQEYPYILLSMTIEDRTPEDSQYWEHLTHLLATQPIQAILDDTQVAAQCRRVVAQNKRYRQLLLDHTVMRGPVAVTDFRPLHPAPAGNRFLGYCLFPDSIVQIKIRFDKDNPDKVIASVGHSIFNNRCQVNVGKMLSRFNGGGHRGAGACSFNRSQGDHYLSQIIDILKANQNNEG